MPTKLRPEYVYSVVNMCDLLREKVHLQPYSIRMNLLIK